MPASFGGGPGNAGATSRAMDLGRGRVGVRPVRALLCRAPLPVRVQMAARAGQAIWAPADGANNPPPVPMPQSQTTAPVRRPTVPIGLLWWSALRSHRPLPRDTAGTFAEGTRAFGETCKPSWLFLPVGAGRRGERMGTANSAPDDDVNRKRWYAEGEKPRRRRVPCHTAP